MQPRLLAQLFGHVIGASFPMTLANDEGIQSIMKQAALVGEFCIQRASEMHCIDLVSLAQAVSWSLQSHSRKGVEPVAPPPWMIKLHTEVCR